MPAIIISGIVGAAVGAVATIVTGCCAKVIPYWKKEYDEWENLDKTHIKNVGGKAIELTRERFNIERHVNTANQGKNEVTKGPSQKWRTWSGNVDEKIGEWEKLMSQYKAAKKSWCKMCLCLSSAKLVAKMEKIEEGMRELYGKMDVNEALVDINTPTFSGNLSDENRSELSWLDKKVEKILKRLETSNKIGVHGDPYIGKTMIVKALEDKVKKQCSFEEVFFVMMKEGEREEQIRQHIAKQLKISIESVSDVIRSNKCLLILDQVSEHIELSMLAGSPWKVLVVTRYLTVCNKMRLDDFCKVERMDENDAQSFFRQQINGGDSLPRESKNINDTSIAKIVNECGSMPQLIKVVAAYLQKYTCDWEKFGKELVSYKVKKNEPVNDVYKTLEVVLKKIPDDREKYYVHASLLPPEKDIFKDYLIECWWAHGCIKSDAENNLGHPLRATRLKGHGIIQDLLKGCFLIEGGEENCVRIPNICRDWVFETEKHLVGNSQMKPDDVANAIHISLIDNNSICTLLWRCQDEVSSIIDKISDCVSLRVLDLSHTEIDDLPSTIFELANLKALYLNDCKGLSELPLNGGEVNTSLEILDICRSGIQDMPMGIAKLQVLKCLRVSLAILGSYDKTPRIIGGLKSLEEFTAVNDGNLEENWKGLASAIEDLARSKSLNVLWFTFPNASGLENFVRKSKSLKRKDNLQGEKIFRSFKLLVDCPKEHHEVFIPQPTEYHLRIFKESSNRSLKVFSKVMKQTTSLELINHNTIEYLSSFGMDNIMELKVCVISGCEKMKIIIRCKGNFSALTTLTIKSCSDLKAVFSADVIKQIPCLKYLKVESCQNMSMIFGEDGKLPTIVNIPSLESLELIDLPILHSICSKHQLLVCLSLWEMMVQSCPRFQVSSLDKICTKFYVQLKCEKDLKKKLVSEETYFKCHLISAHQLESYDGGKKVDDGSTKGKAKVDTEEEPLDTNQNPQQSLHSRKKHFEMGESSKQNDYNQSPEAPKSERKDDISPVGSQTTPSEVTKFDSHISEKAESAKFSDDSVSPVPDHEVAENVPVSLQLVALKRAYEFILKVKDNLNRSAEDPEILEETREHLCNLEKFIDTGLHKETFRWLIFVLNDVKIRNKNAGDVLAKYGDLKLKRAEAIASKSYSETKQKELGTTQVQALPGKLSINRDRWEEDIQKYEDEIRKLEKEVSIAEKERKQTKETLKEVAKSLEVEALVTYIEQESRKFNVSISL